jgi:hypothetical protein
MRIARANGCCGGVCGRPCDVPVAANALPHRPVMISGIEVHDGLLNA